MSNLFSLLPDGGWPRLLCDVIWQSTLICAIGLIAARLLIRQSAARAWLLLLTISGCAIAPVATFVARVEGVGLFGLSTASVFVDASPAIQTPAESGADGLLSKSTIQFESANQPPVPPGVSEHQLDKSIIHVESADQHPVLPGVSASSATLNGNAAVEFTWSSALAIVWSTSSALLAIRLLLSLLATWRLLREAAPCDDEKLLAAAWQAAQRVGLAKSPLLFTSPAVATPTVLAFGRGRLLIPHVAASGRDDEAEVDLLPTGKSGVSAKQDTSSRLGETRLRDGKRIDWTAAFTHELAHVARRDGWARLWVEFVLIAIPLQPLIWLARRGFRIASEEACDDLAVTAGTNPIDLAETLTVWINMRDPRIAPVGIGMSSTKARTLRLLALRDQPIVRLSALWKQAGVLSMVLLLVGLAVAQTKSGDETKTFSPWVAKPSAEVSKKTSSAAVIPDQALERAIADDALVSLYTRRIQETKAELAQA
ncbi:MAG TPA: M56 family metallopeptidase, partial [Pirellulales bacterium]